MRNADRKTEVFEFSSGLKVEMAQVMFSDENILAKARKSRRSQMDKILAEVMDRCTVQVADPGPYRSFLEEGKKVDWDKINSGDRIEAMLKLRMLSYKDGQFVTVPDLKCTCRNIFSWRVDILEDLRWLPLPKASIENMKQGKPFEVKIGSYIVFYILPTAETEQRYKKMSKQYPDRDMACGLRSRIVDVKGPDGQNIERREIMDWLDGNDGRSKKYPGLTSEDGEELRDAMDRVDGGVDLEVTAYCDEADCGAPLRFDLPFDSIFLPGEGIQKRRMKRRLGAES